jgi:hypothetical protein
MDTLTGWAIQCNNLESRWAWHLTNTATGYHYFFNVSDLDEGFDRARRIIVEAAKEKA